MSEHLVDTQRRGMPLDLMIIKAMLLRGKVQDAERKASLMSDPSAGTKVIEGWKETYRGIPHGQWDGGMDT